VESHGGGGGGDDDDDADAGWGKLLTADSSLAVLPAVIWERAEGMDKGVRILHISI
jgi:hypothetical protein